jgi:hypothetical protein
VSYAVFSLVCLAVEDHACFRLIILLLARCIRVNCFLSTNLSSFLLPACRLLVLLCCLVLCGMLAAVDHACFRLIILLLARYIRVNCFLSTNLSSFLLPACQLLVLLCCLVLCGMLAAWSILCRMQTLKKYRMSLTDRRTGSCITRDNSALSRTTRGTR